MKKRYRDMDKNDIKKLLQKGERLTLEAKLAKVDVPSRFG